MLRISRIEYNITNDDEAFQKAYFETLKSGTARMIENPIRHNSFSTRTIDGTAEGE